MTKDKQLQKRTIEQKNILGVGTFKLFNSICDSMIKSFGGVFIYKNSGLLWHVFLYLIVYSLVQIASNFALVKLFSKHSKLSLILRTVPFLLLFGVFFLKVSPIWFTLIISVTNGLINSFYLAPMDKINGSLKSADRTKTQSIIQAMEYMGKIIVTLIIGFVLDSVDVRYVAFAGIILYLTATVIFFFVYKTEKTETEQVEVPVTEKNQVIEATGKKFNPFKNYYPWLTEALIGAFAIVDVLWGVYAYTQFNSFATVGIMKAIIATGSLISTIAVGKFLVRYNWKKTVIIALVLFALIWIVRPFATNEFLFYGLTIIAGFIEPVFFVPLNSTYYKYYKYDKNKSQKLVQKDAYRKLFAVPLSLICLAIGSLPASIVLLGSIIGLASFQVGPANRLYCDYKK